MLIVDSDCLQVLAFVRNLSRVKRTCVLHSLLAFARLDFVHVCRSYLQSTRGQPVVMLDWCTRLQIARDSAAGLKVSAI